MTEKRQGRAWMALLQQCKDTHPWVCHLCGDPIPRGVPRDHPLAYQADHLHPHSTHPHLAMVLGNLRPSHRRCNRWRDRKPLTPELFAEMRARFGADRSAALSFFD